MGQRYSHVSLEERCRLRGMMEMSLSISEIARRMGRIGARSGASSSATGASTATDLPAPRAAPGRVSFAARRSRAPPAACPGRGPPCLGVVPGADRGADGARRIGSRDQRGVHLPPCLQPGRSARRAAAALGATQAETRPSATKRAARAGHPQPHADPSAADKRRSRLTLARRLLSKDADLAASAIVGELRWLPARARRTVTHDNGGEFARHEAVTSAIGLHAYFATRTALGSAARSRTPTAGSDETFPARPASQDIPTPTSTTSSGTSTEHLESASDTAPPSRHSLPTSVSHLKCEIQQSAPAIGSSSGTKARHRRPSGIEDRVA